MAKAKVSADDAGDAAPGGGTDRLTNVLALLLVKGHNQTESIQLLSRAGFQAQEIGGLLGCTANTVSVTLYKAKNKPKARRGKNAED